MNKTIDQILRVTDLSKSFQLNSKTQLSVLRKINFNLNQGETCALVGLSGSGKTTLLRCLLQLDKPDSGQVIYNGIDITKLSEDDLRKKVRHNLRMVYQHPEASLNPGLKVLYILLQPFLLYNPDKKLEGIKKCEEILLDMGLDKQYLDKYQHELSGGEKRRVSLARALITEPKLLIADEPLAGLDKVLQYRMLKLLFDLKIKYNLTILLVSHDIDIMLEICDKIFVLHDGEIVEIAERINNSIIFTNKFSKHLVDC